MVFEPCVRATEGPLYLNICCMSKKKSRKADDKIYVCKISNKCIAQATSYRKIKEKRANSAYPDEMAHFEPPHLDLQRLQLQPFQVLSYDV